MQIMAFYSGLLGLLLIALSYNVAAKRKQYQVGIGDGNNNELERAIRVQANFIEYVPVALILLAVFESNSGNKLIVHLCGGFLIIARLLHAYGLGKTVRASFGRVVGTSVTWLMMVILACLNIYFFVVRQVI